MNQEDKERLWKQKRDELFSELYDKGSVLMKEFEQNAPRAQKVNNELLFQILKDNQNTEYGRKYHFDEIHSVEDYQRKIPYSTYKDYSGYISRMMDHGEENLITSYPINTYLKTSGTQGNAKYIPFSQRSMESTREVIRQVVARAISKIGWEWTTKKALQPMVKVKEAYNDTTTVTALSSYMLVDILFYDTESMLLSPEISYINSPEIDATYLHARYALANKEVRLISSSFMTFIMELLLYIMKNQEMLISDIEHGTIDSSVMMPMEVRQALEKELVPDKERAEELKEALKDGEEGFAKRIWKQLNTIVCIGGGAFRPCTKRVQELIGPDVNLMILGYYASECVFSIPLDINSYESALVVKNGFYEFLPVDEPEETRPRLLSELEPGKEYEVIVTNFSGFYRYRIGDVIKVYGYYKQVPMIEFSRRVMQNINMFGEKTSVAMIENAMQEAIKMTGQSIENYSAYADTDGMCYTYFVEFSESVTETQVTELEQVLHEQLKKLNPFYDVLIAAKKLEPLQIHVLKEDTYERYRELLLQRGANASQIKPVHILTKDFQKDFFTKFSDPPFLSASK